MVDFWRPATPPKSTISQSGDCFLNDMDESGFLRYYYMDETHLGIDPSVLGLGLSRDPGHTRNLELGGLMPASAK